jgi:hypothetical protein
VAIVGFTIFVTWPQSQYIGTRVASHDDSFFSMWRLAWIAHALATDPRHLFDANIFHPVKGTLAFSDAMLLEGLIGAPLFWAGVSPLFTYNLLLLAGFVGSGVAMFVLARQLLGATVPALVAAAIFTMAPYRIEHFMHLELQWAMWIPLTFWALHRSIDEASWRFGILAGLFVWLQILSCVYYGVFLAMTLVVFVPLLLVTAPRRSWRTLTSLLGGAIVSLALTIPYAVPYVNNARALGPRTQEEVAEYSGTLSDYVANPPQNWLWGWTAGGPERNLAPGIVAILLAAAALLYKPRRLVLVYAALAALCLELSLGLNGRLYSWLFEHSSALHGLRSPVRFAVITSCAVAMLAGFGVAAISRQLPAASKGIATAGALTFLLLAIDYRNTGMILMSVSYDPGAYDIYKAVRTLGPGVVVELPLPTPETLPGRDAHYAFSSIAHWHPLVNGYSGYYPFEYAQTLNRMENFPDDRSIQQLTNLGVRYIVVHQVAYGERELTSLLQRMRSRSELRPYGIFDAYDGEAALFLLQK